MALVSVVIPAYNAESSVAAAIASATGQIQDLEVIVVDDCSTDATYDVSMALAAADKRIHVHRLASNSGGPAEPRNHAIRTAVGRYISFLDADDLWRPNKLRTQITSLENSGASLCCSGYTAVAGKRTRQFVPAATISLKLMTMMNQIGMSTVLYDRAKIPDVTFRHIGHEDYDAWLRLLLADQRLIGLQADLAIYKIQENSASSSPLANLRYLDRIYRCTLGDSPTRALIRASEYAALSRLRYSQRGRAALMATLEASTFF